MFAMSCLENLLSHFCASSNAHTHHTSTKPLFTLIETGQGRGNTNARIVSSDRVCDMVAGIMVQEGMQRAPIGVLLDPIVRQVTSETGMPLDQFEFRLFMSLSSHQSLKSASHYLYDLMARTVLHDNSLHAQLAAHVIASVARHQGHKAGTASISSSILQGCLICIHAPRSFTAWKLSQLFEQRCKRKK